MEALLDWQVVLGPEVGLGSVHVIESDEIVLEEYVQTSDGSAAELRLTRVDADGDRDSLEWPTDRILQIAVEVDGGVAYSLTSDSDDSFFEIGYWRDGAETAEVLWGSEVGGQGFSEIASRDGRLLFMRMDGDVMCIVSADISSPDPTADLTELACGAPGEILFWLRVADDGTLSYVVLPEPESECGRLVRLVDGSGTPEAIPGTGCVSRGAANATVAVWTAPPIEDPERGENWFDVPEYALADGQVIDLGSSVAGSVEFCQGKAYWNVEQTAGSPAEVRRWSPSGSIEVVYRSPRLSADMDGYATGRTKCFGDRVGLIRADSTNGYANEELVYPAVDWTVPPES